MLKRTFFLLALLISACVTVNIYFPAAAVERAAEQIVKETWGGPGEPAKAPPKPQSTNRFSPMRAVSLNFVSEAHAQEADINVSNPAIRALKDSIGVATREAPVRTTWSTSRRGRQRTPFVDAARQLLFDCSCLHFITARRRARLTLLSCNVSKRLKSSSQFGTAIGRVHPGRG